MSTDVQAAVPPKGQTRPVGHRASAERASHEYIPQVDGLRTIAVIAVILYHLGLNWLPGGFVGVDIFFVISGFVVTTSVSRLSFDRFGSFLLFFYSRRILRIMPALVLCVLVTLLMARLFVPQIWLSRSNNVTGLAALFGLSNFALAFNADTYFSPTTEFNPFTHTWSLGVEEQFYLIFPFLWFFCLSSGSTAARRRNVIGAIALLSVASLVFCAVISQVNNAYAFYLIPSRFWELGVGVLLSATMARWRPALAALGGMAGSALTAVALALVAIALLLADNTHFPFPWAIVPVAGTALLIAVITARAGETPALALASAPMVYLGKRSYSLYLWHWPVIVLLRWTVGLDSPAVIAAALVLTFALALSAYRLVEVPIRSSAAIKARPRYQIVAAGVVMMLLAAATGRVIISSIGARIQLSRTAETAVWFPDTPLDVAKKCVVKDRTQPFASGTERDLTPDCATTGPHLFVMGDSHAGAYFPMLAAFAAKQGSVVTMFDFPGCGTFRLSRPLSADPAACLQFVQSEVAAVEHKAKPGDVVFLPSLRLPRTVDQWGPVAQQPNADPASRAAAVAEAESLLRPLAEKGVKIVFEAPKPIFGAPPMRCSDWFNSMNPICKAGFEVPRAEIEAKRAAILQSMHQIAADVPGVSIWDPLPSLCPEATCNAFANGKPLFLDADHISRYGNSVVFASFENYVLGLKSASG